MKKVFVFILTCAVASLAQDMPIENAQVEKHVANQPLAAEVKALSSAAKGPFWIGWQVAMVEGEHHVCCFDSYGAFQRNPKCAGGCRLENDTGSSFIADKLNENTPVKLERPHELAVLVRVTDGSVDSVRSLSADCAIEAGGRT